MNYEIYIEGYRATGESAGALHVGKSHGYSFINAVSNYVKTLEPDAAAYWTRSRSGWSYWGCDAYPTLHEAQRAFG